MNIWGLKITKVHLAHMIMLTCQLFYSGWHLIGSVAIKKGADPFVFVLYRELFSSLIMLFLLKYRGIPIVVDPKDYTRFAVLGLCSFVNVVGAMLALKYISASRFAIFQPSIPCIATIVSIFLGLERITLLKCLGILLAVSGAILAEAWQSDGSSSNDDKSDSSSLIIGTIIVTVQVIGMACLVVFSKPILSRYNPAVVTFVYYAIGTILTMFLFAGYAFQFTSEDLVFDSLLLPWLALLYAVLFPTVFNYNALSWCGRLLAPSTTTIYSTFQPISTIVLSFVILHQLISLSEGIGAVCVVCGLILTVTAQQYDTAANLHLKKDSVSSSLSSSSSFSSHNSDTQLLDNHHHNNPIISSSTNNAYTTINPHDDDEEDPHLNSHTQQSSGNSSSWSRQKQLVSVTANTNNANNSMIPTVFHRSLTEDTHDHLGEDSMNEDGSCSLHTDLSAPLSPLSYNHNHMNNIHSGNKNHNNRQLSGDTQSSGGLSSISSGRRSLTAAGSAFPAR